MLRNAIFANGGIGIDLVQTEASEGSTPNDPGDGDSGVNGLQNTPIIASSTTSGGATTVRGTLNSTPNRTFLIQVFADPAGNEGKVFQGETRVRTNASGNANFAVRSEKTIPASHNVTATATGDEGTSEFSPPFQ